MLLALSALVLPGTALAEESSVSIRTFAATPIPDGGGTCPGCGGAFHLELEYVLEGEGYGATPARPRGGLPPLSAIKLYLPEGVQEHPAAFGQCTEATIKNTGPAGCPANSVAGEAGYVSAEVTFGPMLPSRGPCRPSLAERLALLSCTAAHR